MLIFIAKAFLLEGKISFILLLEQKNCEKSGIKKLYCLRYRLRENALQVVGSIRSKSGL